MILSLIIYGKTLKWSQHFPELLLMWSLNKMAYFSAEKADSEYVGHWFCQVWLISRFALWACVERWVDFSNTSSWNIPKNSGGGGRHSYIIEDMDVRQGFSNHYPFADKNFGKILDPLQTNGGTFSKIYTVFPRFTPLLELVPLLGLAPPPPPIRLQILISAPVRVSISPWDKRLFQISLNVDQKDGEPQLFSINWQVNH